MRSRKLYSVGVVSMLVVLASVAGVAFTAGSGTNADTGNVLAQENNTTATTEAPATTERKNATGEPNDNRENATPLPFHETIHEDVKTTSVASYNNQTDISPEFGPGDTEDWFSFEVEAGQAIRAWATVGMGDNRPTAYLVGPDGQQLAEFGGYADLRPTGLPVNESGTYYIRMVNNSETYDFGYSFHVQVAREDQFEPNNDRSSAAPITPNEPVNTTLTPATETDWFAVNASNGATINATVAGFVDLGPEIRAPLSVDVFDSDGNRISEPQRSHPRNETSEYDGPNRATVTAESVEAGTYYIRIASDEEYITGLSDPGFGFSPYRLTVSGEGLEKFGTGSENTTTPTTTAGAPSENTTPTTTTTTSNEETTTSNENQKTTTANEAAKQNETTYYQVDFVAGEPIHELQGPNGTYSNGELIRFAHGSSEQPIARRSVGEFTTNDTLADRIESHDITIENGTATTTFTVSEGAPVTLSLVSYTKPGAKWSPETEHLQQFVDSETHTYEPGTHTLTVDLPTEKTGATNESQAKEQPTSGDENASTTEPLVEQEQEPNDYPKNATRIEEGRPVTARITEDDPMRFDLYRYHLDKGDTVSINATVSESPGVLEFRLTGDNESLTNQFFPDPVTLTENESTTIRNESGAENAGTFYLRVLTNESGTPANYSLTLHTNVGSNDDRTNRSDRSPLQGSEYTTGFVADEAR